MSSRLSDIWKAWINEALPKLAPNDRAKWEIAVIVGPRPKGPPGLTFGLFVTMPAPVMGHHLQRMLAIDNPQVVTKEQLLGLLTRVVTDLHTERSAMLSGDINGGGPPLPPGPPGIPPEGIILR